MVWTLDSYKRVSNRKYDNAAITYHLLRYHDDSLDRELPVAVIKQVFQAGSEQVDDQDVVEPFLAEVIDVRDPG